MAKLTLPAYKLKWTSPQQRFRDNDNFELSEADLREFALDTVDTFGLADALWNYRGAFVVPTAPATLVVARGDVFTYGRGLWQVLEAGSVSTAPAAGTQWRQLLELGYQDGGVFVPDTNQAVKKDWVYTYGRQRWRSNRDMVANAAPAAGNWTLVLDATSGNTFDELFLVGETDAATRAARIAQDGVGNIFLRSTLFGYGFQYYPGDYEVKADGELAFNGRQGVRLPRLTQAEREAILLPRLPGLKVYQTDGAKPGEYELQPDGSWQRTLHAFAQACTLYTGTSVQGYPSAQAASDAAPFAGRSLLVLHENMPGGLTVQGKQLTVLGNGFTLANLVAFDALVHVTANVTQVYIVGGSVTLHGNVTFTSNSEGAIAFLADGGAQVTYHGDLTVNSTNSTVEGLVATGNNTRLTHYGRISVPNKGWPARSQGAQMVLYSTITSADRGITVVNGQFDLFGRIDTRRTSRLNEFAAPLECVRNAAWDENVMHHTLHAGHELLGPASAVSILHSNSIVPHAVRVVGLLVASSAPSTTLQLDYLTPVPSGGDGGNGGAVDAYTKEQADGRFMPIGATVPADLSAIYLLSGAKRQAVAYANQRILPEPDLSFVGQKFSDTVTVPTRRTFYECIAESAADGTTIAYWLASPI